MLFHLCNFHFSQPPLICARVVDTELVSAFLSVILNVFHVLGAGILQKYPHGFAVIFTHVFKSDPYIMELNSIRSEAKINSGVK